MTILPANRLSADTENAPSGKITKSRRDSSGKNEAVETANRRAFRKSATPEQTRKTTEDKQCEEATGFNSEDEYEANCVADEDWTARDKQFAHCLAGLGYEIKEMDDDGACLFRAIADQIFGDQELHLTVRTSCMDYIETNKDYFAPYVTEDFNKYIARKRKWNVHGNHLEIQAMSEMYNRTIEVYCYESKPINTFNSSRNSTYEPIRISYHRMCHYNSIINPNKPSVGVGLGLPSYHTVDLNRRRIVDAVRASEDQLIEQTMLEDKLKATDWEATSEALENEVARESYMQYLRDLEKKAENTSTSPHRVSPKSRINPKSTKRSPRTALSNLPDFNIPNSEEPLSENLLKFGFDYANSDENCAAKRKQSDNLNCDDNWEDVIMAQILAESRMSYLENLKRNSKNQNSPGPSTSQ